MSKWFVIGSGFFLGTLWIGIFIYNFDNDVHGQITLFNQDLYELLLFLLVLILPLFVIFWMTALVREGMKAGEQRSQYRDLLKISASSMEHLQTNAKIMLEMRQDALHNYVRQNINLHIQEMTSCLALIMERSGLIVKKDISLLWEETKSGNVWIIYYSFIHFIEFYPELIYKLGSFCLKDQMSMEALHRYLETFMHLRKITQQQGDTVNFPDILSINYTAYRIYELLLKIVDYIHRFEEDSVTDTRNVPMKGLREEVPSFFPEGIREHNASERRSGSMS